MGRLRFPHPLVLMVAGVLLGAAATHVVPAGAYERRDDPATGRRVVVAGTWHEIEPAPVGAFRAAVAIPRGIADATAVIALVFLIGGAFTVVERTGALTRAVDWMVRRLADRQGLVIPVCCLAFGLGGVLENMQEEIIAFVPLLLLLTRRMGYGPVTVVAMSLGAAAVGAAFSPINPFQVGIAQKIAELPPLSGSLFRTTFLAAAMGIWIWFTARHARRTRRVPESIVVGPAAALGRRDAAILLVVLGAFAMLVVGLLRLGWGFDELSALFFIMGISAGLIGRLGTEGTAEAFVEGFRSMAYAGLLIGFARAIFVVLEEGRILDTTVHVLFTPLQGLNPLLAAVGMLAVQSAVHVPVSSVSGQAVLTLPILVPLGDLLGLPRQVVVLAYQYGAGLCEMVTPTNGALLAMVAASGLRFEEWLSFIWRAYGALLLLALAGLGTAILLRLA